MILSQKLFPISRAVLLVCVTGFLVACSPAPAPPIESDPLEVDNRKAHKANRNIDRLLLKPASDGYGNGIPAPIRKGVTNFASNLNAPGDVLNNIFQVRVEDAGVNTLRFVLNSTLGVAGLFDVATAMGIENRPTDFGETLYVWGAPEGNYVELPMIGPSTERHAVGRVVDTLINPLNFVIKSPESGVVRATRIASGVGQRYQFSDVIDSVLYESEDSYTQARLLYLQNRRFQLSGQEQQEYVDPYEDVYGAEE